MISVDQGPAVATDVARAAAKRAADHDTTERDQPSKSTLSSGAASQENGKAEGVNLSDFHAFMPMHTYVFAPTGDMWPARSINARISPIASANGKAVAASDWLDRNRPVEQMAWAPGLPKVIPDRLISDGGWILRPGMNCFNLYRPPTIKRGDAHDVGRWLDHVHAVFGDDASHIVSWFAHRVQRPEEKINHALVLGGKQGIGKDTLLEPVKRAIGPWNFSEVSPKHMLGRFNGFARSVILRVSEARDLGDVDRFAFYDHMKIYTAAPPDVICVDEKNVREYSVLNCCGVIITTNHKTDGIYLPADDRRHFVAWSDVTKEAFPPDYWNELWRWYESGGYGHVAAYLAERHLDIRPESAAAQERGVLGHRRREPDARRWRVGRRDRQGRKPRRPNHRHGRGRGRGRVRRLAPRSQEPSSNPASVGDLRLCLGSQ